MLRHTDDLLKPLFIDDLSSFLANGLIGIEKESLRVRDRMLSDVPHEYFFGSALFNKYITTDFSDSQLEFITQTFNRNSDLFSSLDELHHFCQKTIEDEYLWPFSMPFKIDSENQIPLAKYGTSNLATLKEVYRKGLSNRYGRVMQTISGLHFNYSLPDQIWDVFLNKEKGLEKKLIKLEVYFRTLRNIERMNWLILYLFGCSPIVSENFLTKKYKFRRLNKDDFYLPFATSIRMSDLGYNNNNQSKIKISLNSFNDYCADLISATEAESKLFKKLTNNVNNLTQLSPNILQIEDEYYANSRPKSAVRSANRQISKMLKYGVDYVELRSIDLNPFSKVGIANRAINFLEIFLLYCTLKPSPLMTQKEYSVSKDNNLKVAIMGRKPNLKLKKDGIQIPLKNWATEILEEMSPLFQLFGIPDSEINIYKEKIMYPNKTPSGDILRKMKEEKTTYFDLGESLGLDYKKTYMQKDYRKNTSWNILKTEIDQSVKEKNKTEKSQRIKFNKFLQDYMDI